MKTTQTAEATPSAGIDIYVNLARELVELHDLGIRPQVIRGMHCEEERFEGLVERARAVLP